MKGKRTYRAIIATVLAVAVCTATTVYATTQEDIDNNQTQQQQLEQKKRDIQSKIDDAKDDLEEQKTLSTNLQNQIKSAQDEIDKLTGTLTALNSAIKEKQTDIYSMQVLIEKGYEQLRVRLRAIYMAGDASNLEILLGAKNFSDFIDKAYLIKNISDHDKELIGQLQEKLNKINGEKLQIEKEKQEIENTQTTLEGKMENLSVLQEESDLLVADIEAKQGSLEKDKSGVEAEQQQLIDQLSQLQTQLEGEKAQTSGGTYIPSTSNGERTGQKYILPAPECPLITSYWGDGRNHKGIDFACNGSAYGKPIVAVADGTAVVANSTDEWGSGWGYHVMLDHGGGYYTQYAHCSRVAVTSGQQVKQGDIIGYIGNTGDSYGAHLHFECWYLGERYDPSIELF